MRKMIKYVGLDVYKNFVTVVQLNKNSAVLKMVKFSTKWPEPGGGVINDTF